MQNQQIADVLALTAKLLELYSENPFRIKSYQTAAYEIENFPKEISVFIAESKDYELPFHKSILEKIKEIVQTGTLKILEELLSKTPSGVIEMFNIKGLGPKKIQIIWFQLGIDNLGDLLHACYENRLKEVKGFGIKTQESIKKSIEFYFL
jgi:DNA polymerase (family 10)